MSRCGASSSGAEPSGPPKSACRRAARAAAAALIMLQSPEVCLLGQAIRSPAVGSYRVRLLTPLTTDFSRKSDLVTAAVVEPIGMQGAILEGEIREIKSGNPNSLAAFEFHTLHGPSQDYPATATLTEVTNSRGQTGVDESGAPLDLGGQGKSVSHLGSALAGIFSRGSSVCRITVKAGGLALAPGSVFVVELQPKKTK